jgi:hypothetical protein
LSGGIWSCTIVTVRSLTIFIVNTDPKEEKGTNTMSRINFTPEEEKELLDILERYLPELEIEIANTDRRDFIKALKEREVMMHDFIKRLKAVVAS